MNVLIIGNGGREHALTYFIKNSPKIKDIYCIPGNAGTSKISKNINIDLNNFEKLREFINKNNIQIVIIGPEKPLVDGVVDFLESNQIKVFGPNKSASQLEGSKIFTKKICEKYQIPTAKFGVYHNQSHALEFLKNCKLPVVIKADGLAAGKGVYICKSYSDAKKAIEEIFKGKFGIAKEVLVEDFLDGEEMSFFVLCDNNSYKIFNTAQDHKRVFEGDKGKNTGGMGAYSPSRLYNYELEKKILNKIIDPTLDYLKIKNAKYIGFLYAGLMIKNNEPCLIEYNVRMGDPECQTILPLLNNDLLEVFENCTNGTLHNIKLDWKSEKSICIVVTSKGYPDSFDKNIPIKNLKNLSMVDNQYIYHAGTKLENEEYYSTGGRVLNFVSIDHNFELARKKIIEQIEKLNWKNGHYRKDIAYRAINNS